MILILSEFYEEQEEPPFSVSSFIPPFHDENLK